MPHGRHDGSQQRHTRYEPTRTLEQGSEAARRRGWDFA